MTVAESAESNSHYGDSPECPEETMLLKKPERPEETTLLKKILNGLLQPPETVEDAPSVLIQLRTIATYSWLNLLLVFIPISWAAVRASLAQPPFLRAVTDPCSPRSLCVALYQPQFRNCLCLLLHWRHSTGCAPRVCHRSTRHPCGISHRRFAQYNIRKCC